MNFHIWPSQSIDDLLIVFPRSMEDDELPSADGMGGRGSLPAAQCHGSVLRLWGSQLQFGARAKRQGQPLSSAPRHQLVPEHQLSLAGTSCLDVGVGLPAAVPAALPLPLLLHEDWPSSGRLLRTSCLPRPALQPSPCCPKTGQSERPAAHRHLRGAGPLVGGQVCRLNWTVCVDVCDVTSCVPFNSFINTPVGFKPSALSVRRSVSPALNIDCQDQLFFCLFLQTNCSVCSCQLFYYCHTTDSRVLGSVWLVDWSVSTVAMVTCSWKLNCACPDRLCNRLWDSFSLLVGMSEVLPNQQSDPAPRWKTANQQRRV